MLATSLVFGSFLIFLFFIVGFLTGWVSREYMMNYHESPKFHPEMYDNNGNIIPDEILAVRFENGFLEDQDEEEEE